MELSEDKRMKSRKYRVTMIAMGCVFAGALLSAFLPGFAAQYATFVGGILGAAGLYKAGNVADSWVATKGPAAAAAPPVAGSVVPVVKRQATPQQ
jgi:hypothetical protein